MLHEEQRKKHFHRSKAIRQQMVMTSSLKQNELNVTSLYWGCNWSWHVIYVIGRNGLSGYFVLHVVAFSSIHCVVWMSEQKWLVCCDHLIVIDLELYCLGLPLSYYTNSFPSMGLPLLPMAMFPETFRQQLYMLNWLAPKVFHSGLKGVNTGVDLC